MGEYGSKRHNFIYAFLFQVLVELDDENWENRQWITVYSNHHVFLLEERLVLAQRGSPNSANGYLHPALAFKPLVDKCDLFPKGSSKPCNKPVEFLSDLKLHFQDPNKLKPYRNWNPNVQGLAVSESVKGKVEAWSAVQDEQQILMSTPSVLLGSRVNVYRADATTQWYSAVINRYDDDAQEFIVYDDTVLQQHHEDPRLVQFRLLDGVVESIMRGEDPVSQPRRSRSSTMASRNMVRIIKDI